MQREEEFEQLPVGFKFDPTDVELVDYYLRRRLCIRETHSFLPDLHVYAHAPWDLINIPPAIANNDDDDDGDQRYYCFTCRHRTSEGSLRVNRNAGCGLWDCHGHDIVIRDPADPNKVIGHKVQLNFKVLNVSDDQKKKKKTKTSWIMHEYRLESEAFQEMVLCMIYDKKRSSKEGEMPRPADGQSKRGRTTEVVDVYNHQAQGQLLLLEEAQRGGAKRQRIENPASSSTSSPDYDQEFYAGETAATGELLLLEEAERGGTKRQRIENPASSSTSPDYDQDQFYAGETAAAGELLLLEEAGRGASDVDDDEFYDQALAMEQGPAYANCSGSSELIPLGSDDFFANMFATVDSVDLDNLSYFDM